MSKFIGRLIKVGIGKETSRGTKVAPAYWLDLANITVDDKFEYVVDDGAIGVIEDAKDLKVTKRYSQGEISGKVADKSFGLILLSALGSVASVEKSAPNTGVYDHSFSVQEDAQHDSLTVEAKNPNEQLAFPNVMISSLEVTADLNEFVKFKGEVMGKPGEAAANTPAFLTENNFLAKNVSVKFADDLAGLGAASAIDAKNISIKIEKNLESDDVLGSDTPADILNKKFSITGSIELYYDATTYKTLSLAGTQKAVRIDLVDTGTTIGSSANPEIKIDLAKVKLTEWAKDGENDDIVKQTLDFKAFYSLADSQMISVVLTNEEATY